MEEGAAGVAHTHSLTIVKVVGCNVLCADVAVAGLAVVPRAVLQHQGTGLIGLAAACQGEEQQEHPARTALGRVARHLAPPHAGHDVRSCSGDVEGTECERSSVAV